MAKRNPIKTTKAEAPAEFDRISIDHGEDGFLNEDPEERDLAALMCFVCQHQAESFAALRDHMETAHQDQLPRVTDPGALSADDIVALIDGRIKTTTLYHTVTRRQIDDMAKRVFEETQIEDLVETMTGIEVYLKIRNALADELEAISIEIFDRS